MPRALLIGSSTGGPQALMTLVGRNRATIDRAPVLITQHMPPTFTTILGRASDARRAAGRREAVDGEIVKSPAASIWRRAAAICVSCAMAATVAIALDDGPAGQFLQARGRSAVLLRDRCLAGRHSGVVLTGMGSDGMRGGKDIVAAGGSVIAQDEATSVVWGMPGSPPMPAFARPCCRSIRSRRNWFDCFREIARDAARLRVFAQASEGALRSRAVRRQAISGRKPIDPAGAKGAARHRAELRPKIRGMPTR
jgi:hypothetical protein